MDLKLTAREAQVLRRELDRHLQIMQDEVAHTEKHQLQRALARDIDELEAICRKLDVVEREQAPNAPEAANPAAPPLGL